jgi:hypothetical protein
MVPLNCVLCAVLLPQPVGKPGTPFSENGLEIDAAGFLDTLRLYNRFTQGIRPIFILENGHGDCDDDQRPKFIAEGKIDKSLLDEYASVPYPTDCLSIDDKTERQACIETNPNPLSDLQELFESICVD